MEPFQLKDYDIYQAVLRITEQIHGEFGAAAAKNGLDGKTRSILSTYYFVFKLKF